MYKLKIYEAEGKVRERETDGVWGYTLMQCCFTHANSLSDHTSNPMPSH